MAAMKLKAKKKKKLKYLGVVIDQCLSSDAMANNRQT